jgi:hypothetical protein
VNGRQVPILHTVSALESMRNRGITLRNAIRECVDNSWDWMGPAKLLGTAQIRVHLQKQGDLLTVSVLDNGMGIADHVVEAPDGHGEVVSEPTEQSMDGLQMALRVGGRIKKHHVSPIGRFGFGLPQSGIALCYDTHARVYSKTKTGPWRWLDLDVPAMLAGVSAEQPRPMLGVPTLGAPPAEALPPEWSWENSGTMVTFHEIAFKHHNIKEVEQLAKELVKELGQVYRYAIEDGLQLTISSNEMIAPLHVRPYDPMCQMPASFTAKFGPVDEVEPIVIHMDGGSSRPLIMDPLTGSPAEVVMRFVRLEPGRLRESLGVDPSAKKLPAHHAREHGFRLQDQGFSLVRGQREIGSGETFGLFTPDSSLRYFRGEIRFPPIVELDRLFGIEPDKSKFKATNTMLGWMQRARATITGIGKKSVVALKALGNSPSRSLRAPPSRSRGSSGPVPRAVLERESRRLEAVLPPIPPTKTDEELRRAREFLEQGELEEMETIQDRLIERAHEQLHRAQDADDPVAEEDARLRLERHINVKEWQMKHLQERFAQDAYFRTHELPREQQQLLFSYVTDKGISMLVNTKTPFHSEVYRRTEEDSAQRAALDLVLWSVAYANADVTNSPELETFWQRIHPLIALSVNRLLANVERSVQEEEEPERRRKIEIATAICEALNIEAPPALKGSTVPRTFYEGVAGALGIADEEKQAKHLLFKAILEDLDVELKPAHMSSGATITTEGILAIENGVLRGISAENLPF